MNGVSVFAPDVDVAVAPTPAVQPSSRLLRVARIVARFVHDLLSEVP
jgi:hypothetical protein